MKKIFTKSWLKAACVAVLGLVSVNAWAQEPDATFIYNDGTSRTNLQRYSLVSNGVTSYFYPYNGPANTYSNTCPISFECPSNKIERITLRGSAMYWNAMSISAGSGSLSDVNGDGSVLVWEGSSNSVEIKSSGDSYITTAEVWLESDVDPSLTYSVSLSSVSHGSISASPLTDVHYNDVVTLTATPEAGYSLEAWDVTNNTTSGKVTVTSNTFKMPASDVTVSASFVKYHSITLGSVANGSIYVSKDNNIKEGDVITLAAVPASGYIFDSWTVTNDETSETISVVSDQFTMPDANVTVSATFIVKPKPTDNYSNALNTQALLDDFTIIDANNDGLSWVVYNNSEVRVKYNTSKAMNDYLVSPGIILTGGTYRVSFDVRAHDYGSEKFEIVWGAANDVASLNNSIVDITTISGTTYSTYSANLVFATPGEYYFAIHGVSIKDMYYLYARNFVIEKISDSTAPAIGTVTYTSTIKDGESLSFNNDVITFTNDVTIYDDAKHVTVDGVPVNSEVAAGHTLTINFDEVNVLGKHTVVIPEGMLQVGSNLNAEISYTFDVVNYIKATFDFTVYPNRNVTASEIILSNDPNISMQFSETTDQTKFVNRGGTYSRILSTAGKFAISAADGYVITSIFFTGYGSTYSSYTAQNLQLTTNSTGVYDNHYGLNWGEDSEWTGKANSVEFEATNTYGMSVSSIVVKYEPATSVNVTVTAAGYTTYYNSAKAYTLPAGLTGNVVYPTIEGGFALMPMYEAGDVVPADEPLVLEGAAGDYELVYTETTDPSYKSQCGNLLDGTDAAATTAVSYFVEDYGIGTYTADDCYFFGLSLNASSELESVGFYYMNATGAAFTNGAHKAYLCLPKEMLDGYADANVVRGFSFKDMENGISTGIKNIEAKSNAASFNLTGIRVANDAKGLVIRGGKKIFNK